MEIIWIYIFNIDKKSTLSEKVDMAIFFQRQYRQYRQIEILLKKRYTEIPTELKRVENKKKSKMSNISLFLLTKL